MRKKIISSCFVAGALALSLSLSPTAALAQSGAMPSTPLDPKSFVGDAKYCLGGRGLVAVTLDHSSAVAVSGTDRMVSGSISNKLEFPLFDASLIVQVYKVPRVSASGYDATGDVVERFVALDGIAVKAGGSVPFQFVWHVPHGLVSNVYRMEAFLVVGDGMPVAGSEGGIAPAISDFIHVQGDANGVSYLDLGSVLVNGKALGAARTATMTGSANASVDILNTYARAHDAVLEYRVYRSANINDKNLEYSSAKAVSLQPGKKQTVGFALKPSDTSIHTVVVELKDGEKSSIAVFRTSDPTMPVAEGVFAGLSAFPFVKGQPTKVFGCALLNDVNSVVDLSFVDSSGKRLVDLGSITGHVGLISLSKSFVLSKDTDNPVTLAIDISNSRGKTSAVLRINYACDKGQCNKSPQFDIRVVTVLVLVLIGVLGIVTYWRRKRTPKI